MRNVPKSFAHAMFLLASALSSSLYGQTNTYPRNALICENCHNIPQEFGSSAMTVERSGSVLGGIFVPVLDGGIHHRRGESIRNTPPTSQVAGQRVSLNLLGDGYIEAIATEDIEHNAQQRKAAREIGGAIINAPVLEASGTGRVVQAGRFGWKSQHSSLMSSCADSLRNELGIRNRLYPEEYSTHLADDPPTPFDAPDPKTGKSQLDQLVDEIRHSAPPPRNEELSATSLVQAGERIFGEVGCTICHVPTYKTVPPGTRINGGTYRVPKFLGNRVIHPYSDFLLHDVGTGDGIPQAAKPEFLDQSTANKFRTPPLWGLRFRETHLMHDGDTPSPEQAIKRHAGEASKVRERYKQLSPEGKQQLLAFLNSL